MPSIKLFTTGLATSLCLLTLSSCSDKDSDSNTYRLPKDDSSSTTYRLPKEEKNADVALPTSVNPAKPMLPGMPTMTSDVPPPPSPTTPIAWIVPPDWTEQPAGGMRVGSFSVKGANNTSVDISVIFLGGAAGGDLANVNRWRGQISLPPWSEQEFVENTLPIRSGIGPVKLVDFYSTQLVLDGKFQAEIIAGIIPYGTGTWFFKMVGERSLVSEQRDAFLNFVSSAKLKNG